MRRSLFALLPAAVLAAACSSGEVVVAPVSNASISPVVEAAPTPASTPESTPTPSPEFLPGVTGESLTAQLDDKGFECQSDTGDMTMYQCDRLGPDGGYLTVGAYGTPSGISSVTAAGTGDGAKGLLMFIATLPYDGASPDEARSWVESNFGEDAETQFGPATFALSADADSSTLSISTQGG